MVSNSKIEWTEATWNPVTGCSKVSDGCRNCYAEKMSHRFKWTTKPWNDANAGENVKIHPDRLVQPLRWKKPRKVFVNSMSDLFHEQVPFEYIDQVFAVMLACATSTNSKHTFQILTKRPERMQKFFNERKPNELIKSWAKAGDGWIIMSDPDLLFSEYIEGLTCRDWDENGRNNDSDYSPWGFLKAVWPLPNVWLGVSVENQKVAEERIPILLESPAVVRFLSCEPLLGPIDLGDYLDKIDWVIIGGESGPEARPIKEEWVRTIRDQCLEQSVPFFFKQWGGVQKHRTGRVLDGRTWDEYPLKNRASI